MSVQGKGGRREQVRRAGFTTQAEAQRELDQMRDMARRGVVSSHRLTVGQYLTEIHPGLVLPGLTCKFVLVWS